MLTICVGYDPRETVAWHVCTHSILRRATRPIRLISIQLNQLGNIYKRPHPYKEGGSTEFAISRFLAPYIAGPGTTLFLDSDILCLTDITQLEDVALGNPQHDVMVVKHDYKPITKRKFLGQKQHAYPCKNWSSVMLFNGHRMAVRNLTPEYVNAASPMALHRFEWARSIGELPVEWNHLVEEYNPNPDAKLIHFTLGGPWFKGHEQCEYAAEWFAEYEDMHSCETRK